MQHWIFISSVKAFRMDDWLAINDFVEFFQRNKVYVNDIVYLYTTSPVCKIEYKMIVEKINIPLDKTIDDSAYSLRKEQKKYDKDAKFLRLKLLKKVDNPNLHLHNLQAQGMTSLMKGNFKVSGELLDYIEEQFR